MTGIAYPHQKTDPPTHGLKFVVRQVGQRVVLEVYEEGFPGTHRPYRRSRLSIKQCTQGNVVRGIRLRDAHLLLPRECTPGAKPGTERDATATLLVSLAHADELRLGIDAGRSASEHTSHYTAAYAWLRRMDDMYGATKLPEEKVLQLIAAKPNTVKNLHKFYSASDDPGKP